MHLLVLILRDARTHVRICRTSSTCALLRMRTSIADFTVHHVKQPISFPRRVSAPGVCNFASLTPNEGGRSAEKRSGAAAPVGHALGASQDARERAYDAARQAPSDALRPMTRQYTGRNNLTISMPDGGSVPIVSQTEIDPMKTALSLMLALITTTALTEPLPVPKPPGPGGSCPHGYIASGSFCTLSPGASDAIAKPSNGTCPWGWIASGSYCLRNGRAQP